MSTSSMKRGNWGGGSMGGGKAIAGLGLQGLVQCTPPPVFTTPPSSSGLPQLGCLWHHSAGSPTSIAQQGIGWLLGQPWAAKEPQQHPRPARDRPWALKGMAGQGRVVRMGGVAKWPTGPDHHSRRQLARPSRLRGPPNALQLAPH